jgi:hypothetical protein
MRLLVLLALPALVHGGELGLNDSHHALSPLEARNARVRRSLLDLRAPETFDARRERDRLSYFAPPGQTLYGVGMFSAAVFAAARSPVRLLFDGNLHLGPALLEGYGLGIGFGGRM